MKRYNCVSCGLQDLDKDTVGINKKLLGLEVQNFYCMDCLASYLDTTVEDLNEKIEEFKNEGCKLFE
jgi:biotin operon repressor